MNTQELITEQQPPTKNDNPHSWDLVIDDVIADMKHVGGIQHSIETFNHTIEIMKARDKEGVRKHGVHLQPGNGRDQLIDSLQEALDLVCYLRTYLYGREYSLANSLYLSAKSMVYDLVKLLEQTTKE